MNDVATALAPLVPILDVAGIPSAASLSSPSEKVRVLKHWAHVDVSAKREASLPGGLERCEGDRRQGSDEPDHQRGVFGRRTRA